MMDVLQAKAELKVISEQLKKELVEFERHSGLTIRNISIQRYQKMEGSQIMNVYLSAGFDEEDNPLLNSTKSLEG